ncbi:MULTISPECIES: alpha/beta hydrolase [Streptomycetaceae]|uniref:Lipase n=1 Tax=Streptantibioticus cattleyicolor (strain ATCC 35852 / DSM 46488 / JCM 4925 / NBRC 14057 / NRRL 8057) TaxID=1003195 RepID=F8K0R4_STREN|nr:MULTISPECIES: hydrolase [Streptomycetaceae]AEW94830.1 lipase [Streptantibioticus cattleyicolor NRRL 8057 = DSM 46488]MYS59451.1 hydrolase [Streptomyces sp. SID5468]CCB75186.1 putative hydrolase [Streptantibioticus cattleyicolor NRRL 8057 = DSM 46488]
MPVIRPPHPHRPRRPRRPRRIAVRLAAAMLAVCAPAVAFGGGRADARPAGATVAAGAAAPVRLTLPAPTGPHQVGTVSLHLVDRARRDPWVATVPYRELMVDVRYPAADADRYPRAPQFSPAEAAAFDALNNFEGKVPRGRVDWAATLTHAHQGAPVDRGAGRLPVVVYSPGSGDPRAFGATLADDLASHGFVVVTVDNTYEAPGVRFPDGRLARSVLPREMAGATPARVAALMRKVMAVRVADTRFVLDEIDALAAGRDPDADHRGLPAGLAGGLDAHRVGMYGHSAGGFTAAETMRVDHRVSAGADLDGVLGFVPGDHDPANPAPVARQGLDRAFLLMGKAGNDRHTVPSWDLLARRSTGWHGSVTPARSAHASFSDAEAFVPQLTGPLHLSATTVHRLIGDADPAQVISGERRYLTAFFDQWLRGGNSHGLLDGSRVPAGFAYVR